MVSSIRPVFFFSLILLALSGECVDGSVQLNDDVLGLIVFKSEIGDPNAYLDSWNEDDNSPCSWKFIQCNPVNGRVSDISLDGLGLSGKIGRGLAKLQHLKVLSLSHNNLNGSINPELALVSSLESLNLSRNSLSGRLPTPFANMNSIRVLDIAENSLSGPVPDTMFENCSSLHFLSLAGNQFEGPFPSTLSTCSSLNYLNLSRNHFSGNPDFASGLWLLSRLRELDLSHNTLSGPVPSGVSSVRNLKELHLQGNQFSGLIPGDIGFCPHLSRLDLGDNFFTELLPDSIQRLNSLTYLRLSNNIISGEFPRWIRMMISLEHVDFSHNSITGVLPSSISALKSLNYLSLSHNKLNGSIPKGLFELGLEEVDLSRNELIGSIPSGSSKLFESLQALDLSGNKLTGDIPVEMGFFSKLTYLNLSWNNLQSRMPPELGYIQNLTVLDLRNSQLCGSIPNDICDSVSLGILQLDGNFLTGTIPEKIGNCSSLYLLSLSHNNLTGSIPKSISTINKLKILKLEFNQLDGEIPQELGGLQNLLSVNVSFNRLVGRLPAGGIFPNLDQSALQGNLGLCSHLLKGPCKMNVPKPLVINPNAYGNEMGGRNNGNEPSRNSMNFRHHRILSVSVIVAISAAILISVGVAVISLLNVSVRRRLVFVDNALGSFRSSSSRSGSLARGKLILFNSKTSSDRISNFASLINEADEIGGGTFGTVYKASFGGEGTSMAAIKRLVTSNIIQNQEAFNQEIRILGKATHPNLIALKGYYWTPELQLLVSDYAPKGSLQALLHERPPSDPPLTWSNRFKIVLGTAKGLTHLHSFCPPIIHYNIKPSNILLDENLSPKVSDFGLARLLSKLNKHIITNRFHASLGYMAPELACQNLRINEKCDVYGFGVLVLELVTGRRPVEYGEDNVIILSDHIRVLLEQGNMLECVDPSMGEYPEEEVLPVLKLALVCTSQIPSSRPSMADVVQILQVIRTPAPHRMNAF